MSESPEHDLAPTPADLAAVAATIGRSRASQVGGIDFIAVVDQYESPLLRYVLNLLRCEREQAEDVVQEVFLRLHRHAGKRGEKRINDISSWLFKVAHNVAIDSVRQSKRRRRLQQGLVDGAQDKVDDADQLGDLEHQEACRQAMDELGRLPHDLKQVLLLKVIQGMTLRQICKVTGLSVGNAGYRVNKALGELARKLKEKCVI